MSGRLVPLTTEHLTGLVDFAESIYADADIDKYPDLRISDDVNDANKRIKYFSAFILPSTFNNYNIRQAYALVDENGVYQAAIGVKRFAHSPSWALSWLLSPRQGMHFITVFRKIMELLFELHENIGINEFYVSYPASRESAYSKIMLPFREKYYTFVECTIPAHTRSPYDFIHELMGRSLHPHDMNLRRYILRRPNTEPASQGGTVIKREKN
jgi:hypothetical protein